MRAVALLALAVASCDSSVDEGPRANLTAAEAAEMRQSCAFKAGATAGLTVANDAPIGGQIPIDTILIVMVENRSFDHILGHLSAAGQTDAEGPPDGVSNPDSSGAAVPRFHLTDYCFSDTNHEWDGSRREFDGGKNDGFVVANENFQGGPADGKRAMGYYDETDVPFLYALANAYSISDRHFASVMGATFPNREYLYAATSYGHTINDVFTMGSLPNIMTNIEDYNAKSKTPITWHIYYESVPGLGIFLDTFTKYIDDISLMKYFADDAAAGRLSNINFIDPNLRDEWGGGNDYHPPGDVQMGDQFLSTLISTATKSPQWPHMAIFIVFDEHGGLYDHVPPPKACAPDDIAPIVGPGEEAFDFAQYGFRVPLIVVSPYAKPHYVSHVVSDHTSITRFVESRFHLPAMTARDANADPLYDLFDFHKPALLSAPSLPEPPVDQAKLDECKAKYPLEPTNFFPDMGAPPDML